MKFKTKIPKNIDPIALADRIKKGMSAKFLKRLKMLEVKARLAKGS